MDRNFHTDDFERLLREKSDEFRMYPSKRIWHSIYNNIHPGRKWPSVAMSIMLVTSLLLMGYLNTKNTPSQTALTVKNSSQSKIAATAKSLPSFSQIPVDNTIKLNELQAGINNSSGILAADILNDNTKSGTGNKVNALGLSFAGIMQQPVTTNNQGEKYSNLNAGSVDKKQAASNSNLVVGAQNAQPETNGNDLNIIFTGDQPTGLMYSQKTVIKDGIQGLLISDFLTQRQTATVTIQKANSVIESNTALVNKKGFISAEDKDWIENYAAYHRPATKKWANKLAWQLYVTPSVVYRVLYTDPNFGRFLNSTNTTPLALSTFSQDINKSVVQKPSMGLEIGTGLLYSVSKRLKLKAGLQLNYTRYNTEAFQNTHPMATKITINDYKTNVSYEEIRTTPYSNKYGLESVKLHNETFQFSLPMGAEIKLLGNENLQWNFGVTVQPTYIPMGKSYLISSDRRNFVKEASMLNRWNFNAGVETFLSYKASSGIIFQLGPQFRTQLFSTNSKQIAVEEKLLNYGLKFGISKTIK
ncbi:MAG: hypothetical protein ABIQ31_20730 [Ferruginibacter sp.]